MIKLWLALFFLIVPAMGPSVAGAASEPLIRELKAGILYHDPDGLWSGSRREKGYDFNLELVFDSSVDFLSGVIRPALGGSANSDRGTDKLYLDGCYQVDLSERILVSAGFGVAVHDGKLQQVAEDRKALGSRFLFHLPLELNYRLDGHHGVSFFFDHISNAYLVLPNKGLDTIGIRYGYRF